MGKFDISRFAETLAVPESGTLQEIELSRLVPNPQNFYPAPQGKELDELIASILANGLLEPLTVVPAATRGKYRVISGHSRLTALQYAVQQNSRLKSVPCRVLPSLTEAQEMCAIIEANRQRVKSPALLAQEAKQLTELYRQRKASGEELPGRIRDRVAAALKVSPTKLGNVSAIENGLRLSALRDLWANGRIPENAALEIARLDRTEQKRLTDWVAFMGRPWTVDAVREFRETILSRGALEPIIVAPQESPAASASESPAPGWVPVQFVDGRETPPRAGEYWCNLGCGSSRIYTNAQWNAMLGRWEFLNGTEIDAECLGWYPLPPREEGADNA